MHFQLYVHLIKTQNNSLFDKQFGFRQRRSTATAFCQVTDDLVNSMDHSWGVSSWGQGGGGLGGFDRTP